MTRFSLVFLAVLVTGTCVAAESAKIPAQVAAINEPIEEGWRGFSIRPAPDADDATWCRRVFLDVIGRIPSSKELQEFLAERGSDKRAKLVDRLLHDDRYTEEYAGHWATIWTNLLIGRSGGTDRRSMTSRDGMQKYLARFVRDEQAVQQDGLRIGHRRRVRPNLALTDFNGAVNFLVDKVNEEKGVLATSSTSRIFLGPASPMHAVPQPSVQSVEATEVLGVQFVLSPDSFVASIRRWNQRHRPCRIGQRRFCW